jgi:3-phosphoshikimate 1-carboxyvinyltransferase
MAAELRRLGQEVVETDDSLEIRPRPLRKGVTVETHGDHRFAMSFAILGCRDARGDGTPWLSIGDPACSAKTFPGFFDLLDAVRAKSSES